MHKGTELVNSTARNGTEILQDSEGLLSYIVGPCKHSQVTVCKMFIRECFQKQPVSVKELGLGKSRIYTLLNSQQRPRPILWGPLKLQRPLKLL